jgi:hypothetical protein
MSYFTTAGVQFGWNGGAGGTASLGFIYGNLDRSNSNFSGKFTTMAASTGDVYGMSISWSAKGVYVIAASANDSFIDSPSGTASETNTSNPFQVGNILQEGGTELDQAMFDLRQLLCQ